jgi:toxin ParE1/3/4
LVEVLFRPQARQDLYDIGEHGAERWGRDAGADYVQSFDESFNLLAAYPHAGRARDDISPGLRSWRHRSHIIYYRVLDREILVSRIFHAAADPNPSDI